MSSREGCLVDGTPTFSCTSGLERDLTSARGALSWGRGAEDGARSPGRRVWHALLFHTPHGRELKVGVRQSHGSLRVDRRPHMLVERRGSICNARRGEASKQMKSASDDACAVHGRNWCR